jgi:hypothetical protein
MKELDVLLFVEFADATPWQHEKLAQELVHYNWQPLKDIGWFSARFESCEGDTDVLKVTDDLLRLIAGELRFPDLNAICLISEPLSTPSHGYALDGSWIDESDVELVALSDFVHIP